MRFSALLIAVAASAAPVHAAEVPPNAPPGVKEAVGRGVEALKKSVPASPGGGAAVLGALALVKSGEPSDGPAVSAVLNAIAGRCSGSEYRPDGNHYYTAGLELMLLDAVDAERHRDEMEKILAYVLKGQKPSGAWFYPNQEAYGDTSITQYATLGLWAASRAGLKIPRETWDKLAVWHLTTQLPNGAFTYHPTPGQPGDASPALTLGGTSSLLLARMHLFPGGRAPAPAPRREAQEGKRFGVLEAVDLDPEPDGPADRPKGGGPVRSTSAGIMAAVERATAWSGADFSLPPRVGGYHLYYAYGLERVAALGELEVFGSHDWYAEGAAWLVRTQQPDGTWTDPSGNAVACTAVAVLVLTRATAKSLGRAVGAPELGGGLLAGGRGLPDDLGKVNVTGEGVNTRTSEGALDELLARLEDAKAADVPGVQAAVLEAVRFGDREKLVGERDRLIKLVDDPRPEVRRTAYWALGRGGRLVDVPVLIKGLGDPDVTVAVEAHNALCVFSRRPLAFGIPGDPYAGLPEAASEAERTTAAAAWREKAAAGWRDWYRRVAPYEERDGLGVFR